MNLNRTHAVKAFLAVAIVAGLICTVVFRHSPAPLSDATTPQPGSSSRPISGGLSVAEQATQQSPAPQPGGIFFTADLRWNNPNPETTFARFHDWAEKYINAPDSAKAALELEGLILAKQRRLELAALIQSDPQRALELSVPIGVRRELPESVNGLLEERVSQRGNLAVLGALAEPGRESEVIPVVRTATLEGSGTEYDAFVYGRRLGEPTRNNIPLNGITVDNLLAVNENPVRVLEADEAVQASAADAVCDVSGLVATVNKQAMPVEVAGSVLFLCRPDHVTTLNDRLTAAEGGGPTGGSLDDPQASTWTEDSHPRGFPGSRRRVVDGCRRRNAGQQPS
jgi:hypothetical protein